MKYIEVPDLHFAPEWADVTECVIDSVNKVADREGVDFVAFPGDLTNRGILASERGGLNRLREIIKSIPVPAVAVYGTPSHEPPGSLEHLRDCGVTILEPGKVYGWYEDPVNGWVSGIKPDAGYMTPRGLIFGIPEISKKNIQSQLGLSAEQANAEAEEQLRRYIAEFIAPMRAKHPTIPAVCLYHGNFTDSRRENQSDIIMRASDIISHAEDWQIANLDRITLGHIHTPWESSVVSAGYAGFTGVDDNPYGKPGFKPSMNLVEIEDGKTKITRHQYGTAERRIVKSAADATDPDIAYWIKSKDPNEELPADAHSWSKISYEVETKVSRRGHVEDPEKELTLRELFKMIDPDVPEDVLQIVDELETTQGRAQHGRLDISVDSVEVDGCVFFKGKKATMTRDQLMKGLNGIMGGNGMGKSSLLAFFSPYPNVIGKDTDSGRASSIKDFFDQRDSYIKKDLTVNGINHSHLITLKGSHTNSPKVEFYLTIDNVPQLDCGTFDEMAEMCEKLYGSLEDYLLTSFSIQPLQSQKTKSLMSASMTDIRNLVQHIAGIDRDKEKRYALDNVSRIEKAISDISAWLAGAEEFQVDIKTLDTRLKENEQAQKSAQKRISQLEQTGKSQRIIYDQAAEALQQTNAEKLRKKSDDEKLQDVTTRISTMSGEIMSLRIAVESLKANKEKLEAGYKASEKARERNEIILHNRKAEDEYSHLMNAHESKLSDLNKRIEDCNYMSSLRETATGR